MGKNFTFVTARQIWAGLRGGHVEFWEASFLVHSDPKICTSSSSYCAEKFFLKPETRRALHNARRGVEFLALAMVNVRLHRILAIGLFLYRGLSQARSGAQSKRLGCWINRGRGRNLRG